MADNINIEQAIISTIRAIESARNSLVNAKIAAVEAENEYKKAKHKTLLTIEEELKNQGFKGKITEQIREAATEDKCYNLRVNYKTTEVLSISLTEELKALYAELSGWQSLLKEKQSDRAFTNMKSDFTGG